VEVESTLNPEDEDAVFLDDVFESFVEARSEGRTLDWRALEAQRPHLAGQVRELWQLACTLTRSKVRAKSIGDYALIRELGHGAMGVVHLAAQKRLGGRQVALKLASAATTIDPRGRARFLAEARALARVKHPGVVEVFDVIEDAEHVAFAMERIEGGSLAELLSARSGARTDAAPPAQLLALARGDFVPYLCRVGVQVGRALEAVHAQGLLHRDVKPANILLRQDGSPVLSDFGLVHDDEAALKTQSGVFLGTASFAAPEQLRGQELDARADVYALACSLYYALTGALPHPGRTQSELLRHIESGEPPLLRQAAPDCSRDLETILSKAMQPDPQERYATAAALADDLERVLTLQPIVGRRQSLAARGVKLCRRHRRVLTAAALGAAAVALLVFSWVAADARSERRAQAVADLIRRARLALLDTQLESRLTLGWQNRNPALLDSVLEQSERALGYYRSALDLDPTRAETRREFEALNRALEVLRGEHSAWERVLPNDADEGTLRSSSLFAFAVGDAELAVEAWGRLESAGQLDPIMSALLGHAQLTLGRPELAYPRLARAAERFPSAGFLQATAARAALLCGDAEVARHLLERARASGLAPDDPRVISLAADLAWLRGDAAAGSAAYRATALPESFLRSAEYAVEQHDLDAAVFAYGTLLSNAPNSLRYRSDFLRQARRWWVRQSIAERRVALLAGLRGERTKVGYFFGVLTQVRSAIERIRASAAARVPAPLFALRGNEALFECDIRDGAWPADSLEALATGVDVQSIDWERLVQASHLHERLADLWLAGDMESARALIAAECCLLRDGRTPFGAPALSLPAGFEQVARCDGLALPFWYMWGSFFVAADDLNGDGTQDFVLGCEERAEDLTRAGRVCALSGVDGRLLWQTTGAAYRDLGANLANAGDVDGDGVIDVVASEFDFLEENGGALVVISGASGQIIRRLGARVVHWRPESRLTCLAGADSQARVLVGTPTSNGGRGVVQAFALDGQLLWTATGSATDSGLGVALTNAYDVDGDGLDDVVVDGREPGLSADFGLYSGATGELLQGLRCPSLRSGAGLALVARDSAGTVHLPVALEHAGALGIARLALPGEDVTFAPVSTHVNEGFGAFVQALGDLDGDGVSEYAVSSLSGRSPYAPRVRILRTTGECLGELSGFVWLRRLGYDPLLPAPASKRFVALGLESWSRYSGQAVGGAAHVVILEYRE